MKIERWNKELLCFERIDATEDDIENLFYYIEYANAEAKIEETRCMIEEYGTPDVVIDEYNPLLPKKFKKN
tara:strand:+ start:669 stop:881 length:213 start_codon:yes stop_codon:yes gene_type:complete